jgi:hypothetical protein
MLLTAEGASGKHPATVNVQSMTCNALRGKGSENYSHTCSVMHELAVSWQPGSYFSRKT